MTKQAALHPLTYAFPLPVLDKWASTGTDKVRLKGCNAACLVSAVPLIQFDLLIQLLQGSTDAEAVSMTFGLKGYGSMGGEVCT